MSEVQFWAKKLEDAQNVSHFHFLDVIEEMVSCMHGDNDDEDQATKD